MIPLSVTMWCAAALPILLLLYLMIVRSWPTVRASAAGAAVAGAVALAMYKAPLFSILIESAKGLWSSVSIIIVIVPAILIYEISRETQAFAAIQRDITRLMPDKLLQILAIGWCFTSFLQGPSGFGVPIAVAAPLLICIGVRPFWAVLIPLMAHAWGNTFGTLGLGWEALVQQTGLVQNSPEYWKAALWSGIFTGGLCLIAGCLICFFYDRGRGLRHGFPAVAILGTIMAGGQCILTQSFPALCTVISTSLALIAVFLIAKMPRYNGSRNVANSPLLDQAAATAAPDSTLTLNDAFLPYYVLVGVSVFVLLTPPVAAFCGQWSTSFAFPETATDLGFVNKAYTTYGPIVWLTHSGFFLLLASLAAGAYSWHKGFITLAGFASVSRNSWKKAVPSALSIACLLVMSKVMSGSGQIDVLARGTAVVTGDFYALLAPVVGALGSFIASSNVSSNILFGEFQKSMAALTGSDPAILLAAQTSGGAAGTMFSPSKVLLGTTTAGIAGMEGKLLKSLMAIGMGASILCGIATLAFA